jgi:hypothetical protein
MPTVGQGRPMSCELWIKQLQGGGDASKKKKKKTLRGEAVGNPAEICPLYGVHVHQSSHGLIP